MLAAPFLNSYAIKPKIQTKNALLFLGVERKLFLSAKDETDRISSKHAKYGHVCSPERAHTSFYFYLCEDLPRHYVLCNLHTHMWPLTVSLWKMHSKLHSHSLEEIKVHFNQPNDDTKNLTSIIQCLQKYFSWTNAWKPLSPQSYFIYGKNGKFMQNIW